MGTTSKHLIESQIPYHIRESKPLFAKFLQYYYEFVEDSNINSIIQDVRRYNDIDNVDVDFIKSFFEEFRSLPKNLVTDERFVAKHIYELYQTKGSEQSLKLLFKIVYGDIVNIRYPHQYILRTSDGRWRQNKFVTISFDAPLTDFIGATGTILEFTNSQGNYSIQVTEIEWISTTKLRVYFNSLNTITVFDGQEMSLIDPTSTTVTGTSVAAFSRLTIVDPGSGWKRGQTIVVPGTYKDTIARVVSTGVGGSLDKIEIIEYGWEHNTNSTLVITGAYDAVIGFTTEYVVTTRGYYENDIGLISNAEVRLQDNKFYQQYSYVIDTDIGVESFKDIIKLVHPAGTKYFSQLIKTAEIDMYQYIDSYFTQSTGTKYAQDVANVAEASLKTIGKNAADTATISDTNIAKTLITARSEIITVAEADSKNFTKRADGDSVTSSDVLVNNFTKVETDTVDGADEITAKTIGVGASDTTAIEDAVASEVSKVLADTQGAIDSTAKEISPELNDTISTLESLQKTITENLADDATSVDSTVLTPGLFPSDAIGTTTDSVTSLDTVLGKDETLSIVDAFGARTITTNLNDTTAIGDSVNVQGNITMLLYENVTTEDSSTQTTNYVLNIADSTSASDALSISQVKYTSDSVTSTDGTPVSTYVVYQSEDYFAQIYVAPETIMNIE